MAHGSSPLAVLEHSKNIEPLSLLHTGEGSLSKPGILAISIFLKKIWPSPHCLFPSLLPDFFAQRAGWPHYIPLNPKQLHMPTAYGLGWDGWLILGSHSSCFPTRARLEMGNTLRCHERSGVLKKSTKGDLTSK